MIVNASVGTVSQGMGWDGMDNHLSEGATTVTPSYVNDKDRDRCRINENFVMQRHYRSNKLL